MALQIKVKNCVILFLKKGIFVFNPQRFIFLFLSLIIIGCSQATFEGNKAPKSLDQKPIKLEEFGSINRNRSIDTTQGLTGNTKEEEFVQNDFGKLDIVLVVDNSGSMLEEQTELADKLSSLLTFVSDSDWRIGITSTTENDGPLVRLVSKTDDNFSQLFSDTVTGLGVLGNVVETGILQAKNAIESGIQGSNGTPGWIRSDSGLAVLIISDEDNCSDGTECDRNAPYVRADFLTDYMASVRQLGEDAKVYGIIDEPLSECDTGRRKGVIYRDAINATNGKSGSICDRSFDDTLEKISKDLVGVLQIDYDLSVKPLNDEITVTVDGEDFSSNVELDGSTIKFILAPPPNAVIKVSYQEGALEEIGEIALAGENISNIQAILNGRKLQESEFKYNNKTNKVTLNIETKENDTVEIRYESAKIKRFLVLSKTPTSENIIKVYLGKPGDGGTLLSAIDYEYDKKTNSISINESVNDSNTEFFVEYEYELE